MRVGYVRVSTVDQNAVCPIPALISAASALYSA